MAPKVVNNKNKNQNQVKKRAKRTSACDLSLSDAGQRSQFFYRGKRSLMQKIDQLAENTNANVAIFMISPSGHIYTYGKNKFEELSQSRDVKKELVKLMKIKKEDEEMEEIEQGYVTKKLTKKKDDESSEDDK
jgi:hypothetical protein